MYILSNFDNFWKSTIGKDFMITIYLHNFFYIFKPCLGTFDNIYNMQVFPQNILSYVYLIKQIWNTWLSAKPALSYPPPLQPLPRKIATWNLARVSTTRVNLGLSRRFSNFHPWAELLAKNPMGGQNELPSYHGSELEFEKSPMAPNKPSGWPLMHNDRFLPCSV